MNGIDDSESTEKVLFIYLVDYGYTLPYKLDSDAFICNLDEEYCTEKHYGCTVKMGKKWSKENYDIIMSHVQNGVEGLCDPNTFPVKHLEKPEDDQLETGEYTGEFDTEWLPTLQSQAIECQSPEIAVDISSSMNKSMTTKNSVRINCSNQYDYESSYNEANFYNVVAVKVTKRNKSNIPLQVPSKLNTIKQFKLIMNHNL